LIVLLSFAAPFASNSLAEDNKKFLRPQRTFVTDTPNRLEQSSGGWWPIGWSRRKHEINTKRGTTMTTTKLLTTTAAAAMCLTAVSAQAFQVAKPFKVQGYTSLECAIVRHTPDRSANQAYKVNIGLNIGNGVFQGLDVGYTLVNGRNVDRSAQYQNGRTWQKPGFVEYYWAGTRGNVAVNGKLFHNDRDGWMYSESIITNGRLVYQMLADCHEAYGD
jgi:hypothetical protein